MDVSVIIPTRNRPDLIGQAVASVLANERPDFELLVVDQSTNGLTEQELQPFTSDPRFRYLHTRTRGGSAARNVGVSATRGPILAFTDDDCVVSSDWLERIVEHFDHDKQCGILFGTVAGADDYPWREGTIPAFLPPASRTITSPAQSFEGVMGANMAFRRSALEMIGGFDEVLGAGGVLKAAEDVDAGYRALLLGATMAIRHDLVVIHYGFRDFASGAVRRLVHDGFLASGAFFGKHMRYGDHVAARRCLATLVKHVSALVTNVSTGRRPFGLMQLGMFVFGIVSAVRFPLDREHRLFLATRGVHVGS